MSTGSPDFLQAFVPAASSNGKANMLRLEMLWPGKAWKCSGLTALVYADFAREPTARRRNMAIEAAATALDPGGPTPSPDMPTVFRFTGRRGFPIRQGIPPDRPTVANRRATLTITVIKHLNEHLSYRRLQTSPGCFYTEPLDRDWSATGTTAR